MKRLILTQLYHMLNRLSNSNEEAVVVTALLSLRENCWRDNNVFVNVTAVRRPVSEYVIK